MSSADEIPDAIRKQTADLQIKINVAKTLKGNPKDEALIKAEKQLKRIRNLMTTYDYSIKSGAFEKGI